MIATGQVDVDRIYVTGWSNGASMAYLYGLSRPKGSLLQPHGIAAKAVYSSPNVFDAFNDPCPQVPVTGKPTSVTQVQIFNLGIPTMHVHNDCDILGICPSSEALKTVLAGIGIAVQDNIIDSLMQSKNACLDLCGTNPKGDSTQTEIAENALGWNLGVANHLRWPLTWTPAMLEFSRQHPMNSGP